MLVGLPKEVRGGFSLYQLSGILLLLIEVIPTKANVFVSSFPFKLLNSDLAALLFGTFSLIQCITYNFKQAKNKSDLAIFASQCLKLCIFQFAHLQELKIDNFNFSFSAWRTPVPSSALRTAHLPPTLPLAQVGFRR